MPSYVTPKKNTAYVFYVSLVSQANTKIMQANPTLAAGDVKVAVDDAAPANLATLPTVDGDFTKRVKVSLSTSEMNGDNITVIFSDAAGSEWCDLTINIQTTATQIDNLVRSTTPANTLDVSSGGAAGVDWANVEGQGTSVNLSATTTNVVNTASALTGHTAQTADHTAGIADIPTVAEFNARTLPSADYVVTTDTIAGVTTATNLTNAPTNGDLTATMKASVNTEVDNALDTAIPGTPTADSINQRVRSMDLLTEAAGAGDLAAILADTDAIQTKLPSATYLSGSADADGGIDTQGKTDINAEVSDVLKTDTISEQAQGIPPTTPTFEQAVMYLYMALTKAVDVDATLKEFYNNAGTVVWKKTLSDDGTNYNEAKGASGP